MFYVFLVSFLIVLGVVPNKCFESFESLQDVASFELFPNRLSWCQQIRFLRSNYNAVFQSKLKSALLFFSQVNPCEVDDAGVRICDKLITFLPPFEQGVELLVVSLFHFHCVGSDNVQNRTTNQLSFHECCRFVHHIFFLGYLNSLTFRCFSLIASLNTFWWRFRFPESSYVLKSFHLVNFGCRSSSRQLNKNFKSSSALLSFTFIVNSFVNIFVRHSLKPLPSDNFMK